MTIGKRKWKDAAGRERSAWVVDVQAAGKDGKVRRVRRVSRVQNRRAAERLEHDLREQLLRMDDTELATPDDIPLFADFAKRFMETYANTNNKPSEVESKDAILRLHLVLEFGKMRLDQIGVAQIEVYKAKKLKGNLARKTINNHLTVLRKMLATAADWQLLLGPPAVKWLKPPPPEFDFLTFDEAHQLIAGADDRWRAMITVGVRTGLRLGELLALRWTDVDLEGGRLVVRRSVSRGVIGTPKNGRTREVPLSKQALDGLKAQPHRGPLVFCKADGSMLTKNGTKWPLWNACKNAGLRRIGWHCLRHSFASHLVMRGVPIRTVQELLGHSTIEMTTRYAHLSPDARRDAVKLLDVKERVTLVWETSGGMVLRFPSGSSGSRWARLSSRTLPTAPLAVAC